MTQMLLIDERTEIDVTIEKLFGTCPDGLDIADDTFPDAPDDALLDEVLAARCGSL